MILKVWECHWFKKKLWQIEKNTKSRLDDNQRWIFISLGVHFGTILGMNLDEKSIQKVIEIEMSKR